MGLLRMMRFWHQHRPSSDMDLNKCNIAIWGESVPKGYKLKDGDREILDI